MAVKLNFAVQAW